MTWDRETGGTRDAGGSRKEHSSYTARTSPLVFLSVVAADEVNQVIRFPGLLPGTRVS